MFGLALEGGAARGAYHIGVVKAFYENGYAFDGFVGTSIGAVNAAMLAQDDLETASRLWLDISLEQIFEEEELPFIRLSQIQNWDPFILAKTTSDRRKAVLKVLRSGVSTDKMRSFLNHCVSEKKIRKSGKDFGLVTLSINDIKPVELMLDEIPQNQLIPYIMASTSLPGFRHEKIDGKTYMDGGFCDNCPYGLLLKKGYEHIIAVRTFNERIPGLFKKVTDKNRVKVIIPSKNLGNLMSFNSENSRLLIDIGYEDGLRFVQSEEAQI